MKCYKLIFLSFIVGCIAFTSCKTGISTTNSLALIPGNATMVLEISGNTIFAKSGLNNPDDYNFLKSFWLKSSDVFAFTESFLKSSKTAGISAEKILLYLTELPDYAVIFPIVDKAAFEDWLKKADAPEPKNGDNFRYIVDESSNVNLAWSDKWAIISGFSTNEKIAELFRLKDDGLLATNSDFRQFAEKNADSRMWIQYNALFDIYKNILFFKDPYNSVTEKQFDDIFPFEYYKNISTHSYLNFEDGKIIANTSLYPPEEVKKLKEQLPVFKKNFDNNIIKDMPEQSYLALNMFLDVKEYFKLIRQNIEKVLSSGYMSVPEIEGKSEELFAFLDSPEMKSVIDALGGDILLSIHGFNKGIFTYPLASISFTVNGESAFNDILKLIPRNLYIKEEGYYSTPANKTLIPFYFAYKDNKVFVSNDLETTKAFRDGQKGKTFANNPVSKIMTDKMLFYINLDYSTYPENIKMLLRNFMGQGYKQFTFFIDIYECMYYSIDTDYNMEFILQLKNKNVNALKQILKNIDKLSSSR